MPPVFLKICCIASVEEALLAVAHGAAGLGLVSAMPSGPGVIAEQTIAQIVAAVPADVATFLLTSQTTTAGIVAQQRRTGANTLQLVDAVPTEVLRALRVMLPGVRLVQVIHVRDVHALAEATAAAPLVDALLLDSGDPTATVRTLGGTGRVHDWEISRQICRAVEIPVFLAGGLDPDNVADAIAAVGPAGIDVCSGLRTHDHLDADKLRSFVAALELRAPIFA